MSSPPQLVTGEQHPRAGGRHQRVEELFAPGVAAEWLRAARSARARPPALTVRASRCKALSVMSAQPLPGEDGLAQPRTASMVSMMETVSSSGMAGLSSSPALRQRATSSAW